MMRWKFLTQYLINNQSSKPAEGGMEDCASLSRGSSEADGLLSRWSGPAVCSAVPVCCAYCCVRGACEHCSDVLTGCLLLPPLLTRLRAAQTEPCFSFLCILSTAEVGSAGLVLPGTPTFPCCRWVPVALFPYGLAAHS